MVFTKKSRLFDRASREPFRISRSKIDLFLECPRCFYLDRTRGIIRPKFPAFTLNSAVDYLLKKEFDIHRAKGEPHPLMKKYGVAAVPFKHVKMDEWRENFTGVSALHAPTNFLVFGAVDDLWQNERGELYVVDYKSTAKDTDPSLEGKWQQGYKLQMEVYQWLLRQNGFTVSPLGYFVYVNGRRDRKAFDGKLEFNVHLISYQGSDAWIPGTLGKIKETLLSRVIPEPALACEYCAYRKAAAEVSAPEKGIFHERERTSKTENARLF